MTTFLLLAGIWLVSASLFLVWWRGICRINERCDREEVKTETHADGSKTYQGKCANCGMEYTVNTSVVEVGDVRN